jgi:hypothetical protein
MDGSPLLSLAALRDRAVDVAAVNQKLSDKIARLRERNRELTEELELEKAARGAELSIAAVDLVATVATLADQKDLLASPRVSAPPPPVFATPSRRTAPAAAPDVQGAAAGVGDIQLLVQVHSANGLEERGAQGEVRCIVECAGSTATTQAAPHDRDAVFGESFLFPIVDSVAERHQVRVSLVSCSSAVDPRVGGGADWELVGDVTVAFPTRPAANVPWTRAFSMEPDAGSLKLTVTWLSTELMSRASVGALHQQRELDALRAAAAGAGAQRDAPLAAARGLVNTAVADAFSNSPSADAQPGVGEQVRLLLRVVSRLQAELLVAKSAGGRESPVVAGAGAVDATAALHSLAAAMQSARASGGGECSFVYRYISRESCSQFDSLPLTSLTISQLARATAATTATRRRRRRKRKRGKGRRRRRTTPQRSRQSSLRRSRSSSRASRRSRTKRTSWKNSAPPRRQRRRRWTKRRARRRTRRRRRQRRPRPQRRDAAR